MAPSAMDPSVLPFEKGIEESPGKTSVDGSASHLSVVPVGREHLSDALPPHESYEGRHRWDPSATWSEQEERRVVRKTDLYLMSWVCVMVCKMLEVVAGSVLLTKHQFFGLQLDRGNLQNALTDNLLKDLNLSTNDYNNVQGDHAL